YDHAAESEARVAFEATVVENPLGLVELKADTRLAIDIGPEVAPRAGRVNIEPAVHPDVEKRRAIRRAIGADGREMTAKSALDQLQRLLFAHDAVAAPHRKCAHSSPSDFTRPRGKTQSPSSHQRATALLIVLLADLEHDVGNGTG